MTPRLCPACDRGWRTLANGVQVKCALCAGSGIIYGATLAAHHGKHKYDLVALDRMAAQDAWAAGDRRPVLPR